MTKIRLAYFSRNQVAIQGTFRTVEGGWQAASPRQIVAGRRMAKAKQNPSHMKTPPNSGGVTVLDERIAQPVYFPASANAPRIRAQERMPLWKLLRSYFSFGEWMLSSSRPKPTSRESSPSVFLKSATIGIEAPEPIRTAC